jgi:flagellar biosynthesis/type III secretory pathway chaperone
MKIKSRDCRPLVEMFQAEKGGYEKLVRLLEEEWACLKRRDVTGLITLTRMKEGQIAQVQAIRQKIRGWLAEEGWDPQFPETAPPGRPSGPAGGDLRRALELRQASGRLKKEIISLNNRNKRYIEETLRIIEHFFSLLAQPEEGSPVYLRYENSRSTSAARSYISRRL